MKTIRSGVWETNSSTTHCITVAQKYKNIESIPLRKPEEFPALNANKELEIEMDTYWDMEVKEEDLFDFNCAETIIKYLAAHVVFSSTEIMYGRKNQEYVCNFKQNHDDFLKDLQEAYEIVGLEKPVDVKFYFLDILNQKIYINENNLGNHFWAEGVHPWYDTHKEWIDQIKKTIKQNPDAANWPFAKKYFGMCGNDLSSHSYRDGTKYFETVNFDWLDESENKNEEMECTTVDILTRQISLDFYHT